MVVYISTNVTGGTDPLINANDEVYVTSTGVVNFLYLSGGTGSNIEAYINGLVRGVVAGGSSSSSGNSVTVSGGGYVGFVSMAGSGNSVINQGTMSGEVGTAMVSFGTSGGFFAGETNTVTNGGMISITRDSSSTASAISAAGTAATVITNTGTISGGNGNAISLGSGSDVIYNTGTIYGAVLLGEGANTLDSTSGAIFGSVTGGNGGNIIRMGSIGATVTTGAATDRIWGGAGDDTINSGGGADVLFGGDGYDTINAGSGLDSIKGEGGGDDMNGGDGSDYLFGGDGDDLLDGGGDTIFINFLYGGAGDDVYVITNNLDIVNERAQGGSGIDQIIIRAAMNFSLVERYQLRGDVENLAMNGITGSEDINGTGNALDNTISGNNGKNRLVGADGNDELYGGSGDDTLIGGLGDDWLEGGDGADTSAGGAGNDVFSFRYTSEGGDTINGFSNQAGNDDSFAFRGWSFANLAPGGIAANQFQSGVSDVALTTSVRFFYETDTGILRFDTNGSTAGGVVVIATLTGNPVLTAADIIIY